MISDREIEVWLNDVEKFAKTRKLKENEFPINRNIATCFIGEVLIDKTIHNIAIGFDKLFPQTVPKVFLISGVEDIVPHVEPDGFVCYIQDEKIVDYLRPKDIIEDALEIAISTIRKGLTGENKEDLIEEYEDYWGRNVERTKKLFFSCLSPPEKVSKLFTTHIGSGNRKKILFGTLECLPFLNKDLLGQKATRATIKPVVYIPISKGETILPSTYTEFWTFQELKELIWKDLSEETKVDLQKALSGWKTSSVEYILLGINSPTGTKLIGIECKNLKSLRCHPLDSDSNIIKPSPIHIYRYDQDVIKARSESEIKFPKVLLIGCGSLGSRLATEIVQVGVEELHLVDDDILMLENVYRHQLGRNSVGHNKAVAMRNYLTQRYPFERFVAFESKLEDHISDGDIDLIYYDLIISATGSPNSSFYLNKVLKENNISTPAIYSWNEPYGIGGHNLLIVDHSESCYRCLYEEDGVTNRSSFCEPGQKLIRKVAGCASGFVPFSNLDSLRTCIECVELLKGDMDSNILKSWKGDSSTFYSEGLKTTPRYNLSQTDLDSKVEFVQNKYCKECNGDS